MTEDYDFDLTAMSATQLIEMLDQKFPHRCIGSGEEPMEAHRYAGGRDLIDSLIEAVKEQLAGGDD